jgi:peptide/nickel transport system substrate-binding protein
MLLMNWGPDFPDPDGNGTPFANYEAQSLAWRNSWNDATAIDLSRRAAVELDPAKRVALYGELVDYVQNNGPYAMLYQPTRVYGRAQQRPGLHLRSDDTPTISFWLISNSSQLRDC